MNRSFTYISYLVHTSYYSHRILYCLVYNVSKSLEMVCRILKFFLTSQNHIIYVRYSKSSKATHLRDSISSKALAESHSRRRVRSAFDAAAAIFFIVAAIIFIQGGGGRRGDDGGCGGDGRQT